MKRKKTKSKVKWLAPPMKFNPARMGYETVFPKNIKDYVKKENNLKLSWKKIASAVGIIIIIILLITILMSFT